MEAKRQFGSDNFAGVHPEVLRAITEANSGHAPSYGDDPWTAHFVEVARSHFGSEAEVLPVFTGTAANVIGLQSVLPRWGAVICARTAHVHVDEGGAPEKVAGIKLLPIDTPDGKLTPELVDQEAWGWGDEHRAQPLAVSITQTTELGTTYSVAEIKALADHAHARGMVLHVDGSRLGNAAAHLGVSLNAMTQDAGVDILSLGGTKNGLMGAEAVVALSPSAADGLKYLRKSNMQLASKMRFVSAQLSALYEGDLWLRLARHANEMALRLRRGIEALAAEPTTGETERILLPYPTQSNAVFAKIPEPATRRARERFQFADWPGEPGLVRLMCAFDTTPDDVDQLVQALRDGLTGSR